MPLNRISLYLSLIFISSCSAPSINLNSSQNEFVNRGILNLQANTGSVTITTNLEENNTQNLNTKTLASKKIEVVIRKVGQDQLIRKLFNITTDTKYVTIDNLQQGVYSIMTLNYILNDVIIAKNKQLTGFTIEQGKTSSINIDLVKINLNDTQINDIFSVPVQNQGEANTINISPRVDDISFINAPKKVWINGKQISDNPNNLIDIFIKPAQDLYVSGDVFAGEKIILYIYPDSKGGSQLPITVNLSTDVTKQNGSFNYKYTDKLLEEGKYFIETISEAGQKFKGRLIVSNDIPENSLATIQSERLSGSKKLPIPLSGTGALPNKDIKIYYRKDGTNYIEMATAQADDKGSFLVNIIPNSDMQNDRTGNQIRFIFLDYLGRASNEISYKFVQNTFSLHEAFPNINVTRVAYGGLILPSEFSFTKNYLQRVTDDSYYLISSGKLNNKITFLFQKFDKDNNINMDNSFVYVPNLEEYNENVSSLKAVPVYTTNGLYIAYYFYKVNEGYHAFIDKLDLQGNLIISKKSYELKDSISYIAGIGNGAIENINLISNNNIGVFYRSTEKILRYKVLDSNFNQIKDQVIFDAQNLNTTVTEITNKVIYNENNLYFTIFSYCSQSQTAKGTQITRVDLNGNILQTSFVQGIINSDKDLSTQQISYLIRTFPISDYWIWSGYDDISNTSLLYGYDTYSSKKMKIDLNPTGYQQFINSFNTQYPNYSAQNLNVGNEWQYVRNSKSKVNYFTNGIYLKQFNDSGNIIKNGFIAQFQGNNELMYKSFANSDNDLMIIRTNNVTASDMWSRFNVDTGLLSDVSDIRY